MTQTWGGIQAYKPFKSENEHYVGHWSRKMLVFDGEDLLCIIWSPQYLHNSLLRIEYFRISFFNGLPWYSILFNNFFLAQKCPKTCVNCVLKFQLFSLNLSSKVPAGVRLRTLKYPYMDICGLIVMIFPRSGGKRSLTDRLNQWRRCL